MSLILSSFEYAAPETIEEALALLADHPGARLLAGGHDLVPDMKAGRAAPPMVIDLRKIGSLRSVSHDRGAGKISVGATTTLAQMLAHSGISELFAALHQAAASVGDAQVRNVSTLGGTLASRHPAADLAAPALVFDVQIHTRGPRGERTVAAADLLGERSTPVGSEEIITGADFSAPGANSGSAYAKQTIRATCYPVCGVAATVVRNRNNKVTECRVAATGVFSRPRRLEKVEKAVEGAVPSLESLAKAAGQASDGEAGLTDLTASGEYRLHLLGVLTQRALSGALENAGLRLE
jgi:aerobic carbon-monoxide dehydrogenase medium subunit